MVQTFNSFFIIKDKNDLGQKLFYTGILFLPSALPITIICFLGALIISYRFNKVVLINDNLDLLFIFSLFLIIISTIYNSFFNFSEEFFRGDRLDLWIGLFNWIPLFFIYWGIQNYLNTYQKRLLSIKFLIGGTIPVLVSCVMQLLEIYGPFKSFFNLIIWFNKPLESVGGISGLFSNPNYTGLFLTLILPFLYFFIKNKNYNLTSRLVLIMITISTLFFSLGTNSRNAAIGIIISFISIINVKKIFYFISFLIGGFYFFVFFLTDLIKNIFNLDFINLKEICFNNSKYLLFCKFIQFGDWTLNDRTRIWISTILIIKERPLLGYGSTTFPNIFEYKNLFLIPYKFKKIYHSHNLFLELAYNFGMPVALLLIITIISLIIIGFKSLERSERDNTISLLEKAWLYSFIIIVISHLFDITFYDGKISFIFIILLAGIRCTSLEKRYLRYPELKN